MNCTNCGAPNPDSSEYCGSCGARLGAAGSPAPGGPSAAAVMPRLRTMGIGDMLDKTIQLYRQNWRLFFTIAAIGYIPIAIVGVLYSLATIASSSRMTESMLSPTGRMSDAAAVEALSTSSYLCLANLIFIVAFTVIYILMMGAITSAVAQRFLGRSITTRQAYGDARHSFWRILGVSVVILIILGILYLILAVLAVLGLGFGAVSMGAFGNTGANVGNNMGGTIALCGTVAFVFIAALIALEAYLSVRWSLVLQAIILESKGVFSSMGRSWNLVKSKWWRSFGVLFVGGIFYLVVFALPTYLIQFVIMAMAGSLSLSGAMNPSPIIAISTYIVSAVFGILSAPIIPAISTMLYYDLRIRKEGFDLEMMNQNLEQAEPTGI